MEVRIENLLKEYGEIKAVNNFTTTFHDGELIALLGPSGCGKSTMLNLLSGIVLSDAGKILFDDQDVTDLEPQDRGIGLVFQNYALYPHMSVLDNIAFPLEIKKVKKAERIKKAKEMAALVHVEELLDRKPGQLSGGQQQRVAIARALIKRPKLLLLDEPLSNLDARLRIEMREEIRRIQQETKITTIFVTHDQEEAMSISDHIVLMKKGLKQQYARPQELYDDPANLFVATFLGNPPINVIEGYCKDGKFILLDDSYAFDFDLCKKLENNTKVTLAIRAEALVANNDNKKFLSATVNNTYTLGKEELAYVNIGSKQIRVYLDSAFGYRHGDTIDFSSKGSGIFLFSSESGERIR